MFRADKKRAREASLLRITTSSAEVFQLLDENMLKLTSLERKLTQGGAAEEATTTTTKPATLVNPRSLTLIEEKVPANPIIDRTRRQEKRLEEKNRKKDIILRNKRRKEREREMQEALAALLIAPETPVREKRTHVLPQESPRGEQPPHVSPPETPAQDTYLSASIKYLWIFHQMKVFFSRQIRQYKALTEPTPTCAFLYFFKRKLKPFALPKDEIEMSPLDSPRANL